MFTHNSNKWGAPVMIFKSIQNFFISLTSAVLLITSLTAWSADKPNILVIWGDDIGTWNLSTYNLGSMGFETPNIDRIAKEGAFFTDYYGENSCTAGRSAFITGQHPVRTGLTKVGSPGREAGMQKEDPTVAGLLKPLGYATGQFGKNRSMWTTLLTQYFVRPSAHAVSFTPTQMEKSMTPALSPKNAWKRSTKNSPPKP